MTSKIVVNNIEADTGISTITFTNEVTAPTFNGNIVGTAATFSGNVDIAGALTYEDVTNVDSVGIITAQAGIRVTGGSVGIGTDNPVAKLEVIDSSSLGIISRSGSTQATDTNKALKVRNNSTTDTFNVSYKGQGYFAGKVGIGSDNPGATLDLQSTDTEILLRLNTKPLKNGYLDIVSDANRRGVIRFKDTDGTSRWSIGKGDSDELTNTSFHISSGNSGGNSAKLVITSAGKIGIGESAAAADLVVKQSGNTFTTASQTVALFQRSSTTGHSAKIAIVGGNAASSDIHFGDTDDEDIGHIQYNHTDNSMRFVTNTSEKLRITSVGRMLLGTTDEGHESADDFTISDSGDVGITIRSTDSNQTQISFSDATSGTGEYAGQISYFHTDNYMRFRTNSEERLRIDSAGIIKTPNLNANNHREIHRQITGFAGGNSVVNYLLVCETSRTNVRLAGRLFTARATGTSACAAQLFDITFQTNHNASHRSGAIMGLHSGSNTYGHAEAEFVSLTYNSTNYYAIRFNGSTNGHWISDFDACSFDGIRDHVGTELFTQINTATHSISNVSVLTDAANKGDVTIQQADLRISDGDIIMPSGHGISFSPTSDAPGMTSELLDDYEEGTWTPIFTTTSAGISGQVYSKQRGRYTKIGRIVHCSFDLQLSTKGTFSGSYIVLGGLPYSNLEAGNCGGSMTIGYYSGFVLPASCSTITSYNSTVNVYIMTPRDNAGADYLTVSDSGAQMTNTSRLIGQITLYLTS